MPFRIFTISAAEPDDGLNELNQFLASHRVIEVDKRFHTDGPSVSWHFCVNYAVKRSPSPDTNQTASRYGSIDYKKELSPADFAVYAKLREVRKEIADEKSIQLFTILTNKQLATLATRRVRNKKPRRATLLRIYSGKRAVGWALLPVQIGVVSSGRARVPVVYTQVDLAEGLVFTVA
jgi:hypothetical protein